MDSNVSNNDKKRLPKAKSKLTKMMFRVASPYEALRPPRKLNKLKTFIGMSK
jgi:hypothetical protein